jgi:putative FmdB family regulatory protein
MPIYEYQCAACGRVVEKWQKISEEPLTTCPSCGGDLSKLISSCSFHLKGGGWYVTDYAGKQQTSNMAGTSGTSNESSSGADTKEKADTVKEAKSETPAPPKKFK